MLTGDPDHQPKGLIIIRLQQPPMTGPEFKQALRELRWKQIEFARLVGRNQDTVSRWANSAKPVPLIVAAYVRLAMLARGRGVLFDLSAATRG